MYTSVRISLVLQFSTSDNDPKPVISLNNKTLEYFITTRNHECGGLGNQMFRFASLYGLGKLLNRTPYFNGRENLMDRCQLKFKKDIKGIFPLFYSSYIIKSPVKRKVKIINSFGCPEFKYDNETETISEVTKPYLQIGSSFLQSYKYFHPKHQNEIKQIFTCGDEIKSRVDDIAKGLFKNDIFTTKLCIHIRRGDFINFNLEESNHNFVVPALNFSITYLKKIGNKNISLLFLGNDAPFVSGLNLTEMNITKSYQINDLPPGEDMCLAMHYCDSILLTASGSTFGWWIAYLMPENSVVFYNSHTSIYQNHPKDKYDYDWFMRKWISVSIKNGTGYQQTEWWHERLKVKDISEDKVC